MPPPARNVKRVSIAQRVFPYGLVGRPAMLGASVERERIFFGESVNLPMFSPGHLQDKNIVIVEMQIKARRDAPAHIQVHLNVHLKNTLQPLGECREWFAG